MENQQDQTNNANTSGVNPEALNTLLGMGFERHKCIQALKESNSNVEIAIGTLFSKASDPSYGLAPQKSTNPNFDTVWSFVNGMGLNQDYVRKVCDHFASMTPEALVDYLMNNPFDNGSIPDTKTDNTVTDKPQELEVNKCWNMNQQTTDQSKYKLMGSVVHLGKSVGSGHYVAYARQTMQDKKEQWVYYNDSKVYVSGKPRLEKSYIMLFKRL